MEDKKIVVISNDSFWDMKIGEIINIDDDGNLVDWHILGRPIPAVMVVKRGIGKYLEENFEPKK